MQGQAPVLHFAVEITASKTSDPSQAKARPTGMAGSTVMDCVDRVNCVLCIMYDKVCR